MCFVDGAFAGYLEAPVGAARAAAASLRWPGASRGCTGLGAVGTSLFYGMC